MRILFKCRRHHRDVSYCLHGIRFPPVLCLLVLSRCCANQRKQRDHDGHQFHIDLLPFRVNRDHLRYCSSVTFSIHSTAFPLSSSCTAMCVIAVFGVAPCQCFTPAGIQITSPFRISSIGPPHGSIQPVPSVTIQIRPNGCVCQALRAPASNIRLPPLLRDERLV